MSSSASAKSEATEIPSTDVSEDSVEYPQLQLATFPVSPEDPRGSVVADGILAKRWLQEAPDSRIECPEDEADTAAETIDEKIEKKSKVAKKKLKSKNKSKGTKSAKGKKAVASKKSLGTARGIETMFRSSYRTQLDLTNLAATKANIMISLNGFILSVLTLSGPFVLVAEPLFTAPIAIFLATCLISIIFAVLAAQPHRVKSRPTVDDFKNDQANLLVFEEFSFLNEDEHLESMMELMHDNTRIYKNMSRQIYMLGTMANRKFRMLRVSYTTFLAGLTISTLLLLAIGFFHHTPDLASIFSQMQIRQLG